MLLSRASVLRRPSHDRVPLMCCATLCRLALEAVRCPEVARRAGLCNLFYPAWLVVLCMVVRFVGMLPRHGAGREDFRHG